MEEIKSGKARPNEALAMKRFCGGVVPYPTFTAVVREGVAYREGDLDKWIFEHGVNFTIGEVLMDAKQALDEAKTDLGKAAEDISAALKSFRSSATNDLASVRAAGDKATALVRGLRVELNQTVSLLNSAEMVSATNNAERLARALRDLNEAKHSKFAFAVIAQPDGE